MTTVSVIGAGKMGLPLVCQLAENGARVWAVDVNEALIDAINRAECPIDEPGVPELLAKGHDAGLIEGTTDLAQAVADGDVVVVIVPALLTGDHHADLSILESVSRQVGEAMKPGTLVSYETTVPVGTTRNRFRPLLGDTDCRVAFSPERVKSGFVLEKLTQVPKVVGGIDPESAAAAEQFYATFLGAPVINVETLEAAEFLKLAGMLYRDVNIALSNQLSAYADQAGLNFADLIDPISTNGESRLLQPGIGVGGHCTPVYPYFVIHHADELGMDLGLARQAREINDGQAAYAVETLDRVWPLAGRTVLILGLGFRPGVKEHICSPAFLLRDALKARGAEPRLADSLYSDDELREHGFEPGQLDDAEAVILNTAHPEYAELDFEGLSRGRLEAVLDGRNVWDAAGIRAHGLVYVGIGRGTPAS